MAFPRQCLHTGLGVRLYELKDIKKPNALQLPLQAKNLQVCENFFAWE